MAKKSEFNCMEGQEHKQITKVKMIENMVHIDWRTERVVGGETEIDKGGLALHESPTPDFEECMRNLGEYIRGELLPGASAKTRDRWKQRLRIREVTFNHNSKGITAAITGVYELEDGRDSKHIMPAIPLYNEDIESHKSGVDSHYGEHFTTLLNNLMRHAKLYLGGARGPMQQTIPVEETTEEAA